MKKRIISLLLAVLMCLSLISGALASEELQPEPAGAAEEEAVIEEAEPVENGRTRLYDDMFGRESFVSVDALLDETQP